MTLSYFGSLKSDYLSLWLVLDRNVSLSLRSILGCTWNTDIIFVATTKKFCLLRRHFFF